MFKGGSHPGLWEDRPVVSLPRRRGWRPLARMGEGTALRVTQATAFWDVWEKGEAPLSSPLCSGCRAHPKNGSERRCVLAQL